MYLDELQKQHVEIEALAARFQAAVADDGSPQPLGTLRWQFARHLMAHLALEDRIFYPDMQRQSHERLRNTAGRLQNEMASIANDFSTYMSRWNDDRIAREWPAFCRESRTIIRAVLSRIAREEQLLIPLLAEAGIEPPLRRAS